MQAITTNAGFQVRRAPAGGCKGSPAAALVLAAWRRRCGSAARNFTVCTWWRALSTSNWTEVRPASTRTAVATDLQLLERPPAAVLSDHTRVAVHAILPEKNKRRSRAGFHATPLRGRLRRRGAAGGARLARGRARPQPGAAQAAEGEQPLPPPVSSPPRPLPRWLSLNLDGHGPPAPTPCPPPSPRSPLPVVHDCLGAGCTRPVPSLKP
jgi:hypothetical protein